MLHSKHAEATNDSSTPTAATENEGNTELFEGRPFAEGYHHVDDWVPQRLVTATGPNPLPR